MTNLFSFKSNTANEFELTIHLELCDSSFVPPLSKRVSIIEYANKLLKFSHRLEAWESNQLIGLIAVYCNNPNKNSAYITSVSVLPSYQGKGIGSDLLNNCINHIKFLSFSNIELEVFHENFHAVQLYQSNGFKVTNFNGSKYSMILEL